MDTRLREVLRRFAWPTRIPGIRRGVARNAPTPRRMIVGLGNPGPEYRRTRHNVGFQVLDELAKRWKLRFEPPKKQARRALGEVAGAPVALLQPLSYMNLCGRPVSLALREYGLAPGDLLVAYDDIDLPFGRLRLRPRGGAAGHKGILSIIEYLGAQDFARLRIGVGRPDGGDVRDYVLTSFDQDQTAELGMVLDRAVSAIERYLADGLEAAMNEFNG